MDVLDDFRPQKIFAKAKSSEKHFTGTLLNNTAPYSTSVPRRGPLIKGTFEIRDNIIV